MSALKAVTISTIPGAWYDLSARLSSARAVASCALESLPTGLHNVTYDRINNTASLISAIEDILTLMAQDADSFEHQMKA